MIAILDGEEIADQMGDRPTVTDKRTGKQRQLDFEKDARAKYNQENPDGTKWNKLKGSEKKPYRDSVRKTWADKHVGSVPGDTTYDQWLRKQDDAFQNQVLGKQKAQMYRDNPKMTMDKMIDSDGRPLTIQELDEGVKLKPTRPEAPEAVERRRLAQEKATAAKNEQIKKRLDAADEKAAKKVKAAEKKAEVAEAKAKAKVEAADAKTAKAKKKTAAAEKRRVAAEKKAAEVKKRADLREKKRLAAEKKAKKPKKKTKKQKAAEAEQKKIDKQLEKHKAKMKAQEDAMTPEELKAKKHKQAMQKKANEEQMAEFGLSPDELTALDEAEIDFEAVDFTKQEHLLQLEEISDDIKGFKADIVDEMAEIEDLKVVLKKAKKGTNAQFIAEDRLKTAQRKLERKRGWITEWEVRREKLEINFAHEERRRNIKITQSGFDGTNEGAYKKWEKGLTSDERSALWDWGDSDSNKAIRRAMKSGTTDPEMIELIETLQTAWDKAPAHKGDIYRGFKPIDDWLEEAIRKGSFDEIPFSSGSWDWGQAHHFATTKYTTGRVNVVMKLENSSSGRLIQSVTGHSNEHEILIKHGRKYIIVGEPTTYKAVISGEIHDVVEITVREVK